MASGIARNVFYGGNKFLTVGIIILQQQNSIYTSEITFLFRNQECFEQNITELYKAVRLHLMYYKTRL